MSGALAGISVIDIASTPAGAWCSHVLADFGAGVTAFVPESAPLLELGPFDGEDASIPARYWLANKATLQLDAAAPEGLKRLRDLLPAADILVTDHDSAAFERLGLAELVSRHPALITVHVTPYGIAGDLAHAPGNDLTVAALSGWAAINGRRDWEPLKPSGWQASCYGGTAAAAGAIAALIERDRSGRGQHVDIALRDAMLMAFAPAFLRAQYTGETIERPRESDLLSGPVPVADGHFALTISRAHFWRDAMTLLGLEDLAHDPRWEQGWYRAAHKDEYVDRVQERMRRWTKSDLFDELAARRVVAGPVLTMAELLGNEHLAERRFWRNVQGDDVPHAGPLARMHLGASVETRAPAAESERADGRELAPLAGLRGIVLTQAWAGSLCTEILGFLGAEVIQVEVRKRPDSWRGSYDAPLPRKLKSGAVGQHPWNCNPLYNSVNLGKQCITLDLQDRRGRELFLDLVPHADFIAENFSPRVLGNLGIGFEVLRSINPAIILCSLSAYGATGPWANVPGIGGTIEPTSGMSALLGYEGGPPLNSGQMYPDAVAGLSGAAAILAAIAHRNRTGAPAHIDLSMQEACLAFVGDAALETAITGRQRERMGNRHPSFAPHGMYHAAGFDSWLAIGCETDEQFHAMALVLGHPEWCTDERFALMAARKANENELDTLLGQAAAREDRASLVARLCEAGVPAAPVLDAFELAHDEALRRRGVAQDLEHAEAGRHAYVTHPFRFSRSPLPQPAPAPLQGEHSYTVLSRFLGLSLDDYESLEAAGVTGGGPPP